MSSYFNFTADEQRTVIRQVANKTALPPQAIEKDVWVTALVQIVFSLPFADKLVFKGGTSLSKVWNVIERFSEDIDLSIDRQHFGLKGDLTKKQLKNLRKQSSLFVKEEFCNALQNALNSYGLQDYCSIEPEPDGEGDRTYPEPRKVFIHYQSLFGKSDYLTSEVVLEIGARAMTEPTSKKFLRSLVSENSDIDTSITNSEIITIVPEKTFLEKVFLLHEIFTGNSSMKAERKSRHLYDLEKMMDKDFAVKALSNHELWNAIQRHRSVFTPINGIDYTSNIRGNLNIIPPQNIISEWQQDYEMMQQTMIHGESLPFDKLVKRLEELEKKFLTETPNS
jgi:hypothetical protein